MVSGSRSWELSYRSGFPVPLQKLEKKGITGFLGIPAGKHYLERGQISFPPKKFVPAQKCVPVCAGLC